MLCIRLYSQNVVVSTYCIKFTSFAYVCVPKASKQVRTGVRKKKQDEENEGMKKIELWRHEIICMNNLPSHTGQLNVMVIYNYTIISLLVIYTTLSVANDSHVKLYHNPSTLLNGFAVSLISL